MSDDRETLTYLYAALRTTQISLHFDFDIIYVFLLLIWKINALVAIMAIHEISIKCHYEY